MRSAAPDAARPRDHHGGRTGDKLDQHAISTVKKVKAAFTTTAKKMLGEVNPVVAAALAGTDWMHGLNVTVASVCELAEKLVVMTATPTDTGSNEPVDLVTVLTTLKHQIPAMVNMLEDAQRRAAALLNVMVSAEGAFLKMIKDAIDEAKAPLFNPMQRIPVEEGKGCEAKGCRNGKRCDKMVAVEPSTLCTFKHTDEELKERADELRSFAPNSHMNNVLHWLILLISKRTSSEYVLAPKMEAMWNFGARINLGMNATLQQPMDTLTKMWELYKRGPLKDDNRCYKTQAALFDVVQRINDRNERAKLERDLKKAQDMVKQLKDAKSTKPNNDYSNNYSKKGNGRDGERYRSNDRTRGGDRGRDRDRRSGTKRRSDDEQRDDDRRKSQKQSGQSTPGSRREETAKDNKRAEERATKSATPKEEKVAEQKGEAASDDTRAASEDTLDPTASPTDTGTDFTAEEEQVTNDIKVLNSD